MKEVHQDSLRRSEEINGLTQCSSRAPNYSSENELKKFCVRDAFILEESTLM